MTFVITFSKSISKLLVPAGHCLRCLSVSMKSLKRLTPLFQHATFNSDANSRGLHLLSSVESVAVPSLSISEFTSPTQVNISIGSFSP